MMVARCSQHLRLVKRLSALKAIDIFRGHLACVRLSTTDTYDCVIHDIAFYELLGLMVCRNNHLAQLKYCKFSKDCTVKYIRDINLISC